MSLLDLPTELLQQIISDSRPNGIEALARTCKQVYEAAGPLLKDHFLTKLHFSALVDQASKRVNAKPGEKWYIGPVKVYEPSKAALAIRERPLAGEYVKELEFSETDDSGMVQNNLSGEFEDIPGYEELLAILESSDCIQSAYQYSEDFEPPNELELQNEPESYAERHALLWRTAILKGNASAMFGLLLTLLPNVRGIVFSDTDPHHSWFIGPLIEVAVADEQNCGILSKLETFEINGNCTIHDLSPYLALPSIKTFKIMSIWEGVEDVIDYEWKYGTRISTVEELDVHTGEVDAMNIEPFLRPLTKLRSLRWAYGCGNMMAHECDWDGEAFVEAIGRTAGWHIEDFSLTLVDTTGCFSSTRINHFLSFRTLKHLELDLQLLLGTENLERDLSRRSNDVWLPPRPGQLPLHRMPLLIDILPSSIESVRLWVTKYIFKPERILQHVTKLPNLRQITIAYFTPRHYGVELLSPNVPSNSFHAIGRDLKPLGVNLDVVSSEGPPDLWRRNFLPSDDRVVEEEHHGINVRPR